MSDFKVLLEEQDKVRFSYGGKEYLVGKFSLKQTVEVVQFLANVFASSFEALKRIKKDSPTIAQDLMELIKVLTPDQAARLIGILLQENDSKACLEMDGEVALEILAIAAEHNDIPGLLKKAQRVAAALQPKTPPLP